jgi:hypothetical protein
MWQGAVQCYDSGTFAPVAAVTGAAGGLDASPQGLRFSPDGLVLFVACLGAGTGTSGSVAVYRVADLLAAGVSPVTQAAPLAVWTSATYPSLVMPVDVEVY